MHALPTALWRPEWREPSQARAESRDAPSQVRIQSDGAASRARVLCMNVAVLEDLSCDAESVSPRDTPSVPPLPDFEGSRYAVR
jgi:hypothetical protein